MFTCGQFPRGHYPVCWVVVKVMVSDRKIIKVELQPQPLPYPNPNYNSKHRFLQSENKVYT